MPVREDALPVLENHQAPGQPTARDAALKQGQTEENCAGIHQRFQVIQYDGLGFDGSGETVEKVVNFYGVKVRGSDGDRFEDVAEVCRAMGRAAKSNEFRLMSDKAMRVCVRGSGNDRESSRLLIERKLVKLESLGRFNFWVLRLKGG